LHRDITPVNVFVCKGKRLKLADFGIAKHVLAGRQGTASAFNPFFAPDLMAKGLQRYWLASDDVYQMGQLLAMLLRADPNTVISERDVESLACDEALKTIISSAICPRKTRYANANEMLRALRGDVEIVQPNVTSLDGKTVVFTGPLSSLRRFDAEVMVRQLGGSIKADVSALIDVVVQGARSRKYSNGHKGEKLCLAEKLIRAGHKISIIGEQEFLNLVGA
jgi:NAD-dependent DNA ligase